MKRNTHQPSSKRSTVSLCIAAALGLAVPGMPIGGPGMEMGNRFTPYDILLINKDGSHSVFISVKNAAQQL